MIFKFSTAAAAMTLSAMTAFAGAATAKPIVARAASDTLAHTQLEGRAMADELRRAWLASGRVLPVAVTPTITSGKILTTKLNVANAPAAPIVSISFSTSSAGLCSVSLSFSSATSGQHLSIYYSTQYKAPAQTQGTVKIQQVGNSFGTGAFNVYSAPGGWNLNSASISDCAGNYTSYSSAQLMPLFNTTTLQLINNQKPDTTAPVISAGSILTPKVSLSSVSPDFGAQFTVSDDVSGLSYVLVTVCPPSGSGGSCWVTNAHPSNPFLSGKQKAYVYLGGQSITGQWTIEQMGVCDIAGNCVYDTNSADIISLFGTNTFKVTN
jgi:hypothetical protein